MRNEEVTRGFHNKIEEKKREPVEEEPGESRVEGMGGISVKGIEGGGRGVWAEEEGGGESMDGREGGGVGVDEEMH